MLIKINTQIIETIARMNTAVNGVFANSPVNLIRTINR